MKYTIDEIMDMLDWHQPEEVQAKGRELASEIRCINVFLQPGHEGHCKNVWDNCALILADRSDQELRPYVGELLEWLIDINWPGAYCVKERLKRYADKTWLNFCLNESIKLARAMDYQMWLTDLLELCNTEEQ